MKELIIFIVLVVASLLFISTAKGAELTEWGTTDQEQSFRPKLDTSSGVNINPDTGMPRDNATILVPKDALEGKVDKREQAIVNSVQDFYERKARGEQVTYADLAQITGLPLNGKIQSEEE